MNKVEKRLREEYRILNGLAINGRLLTWEGIKRWVQLYRRYFKRKVLAT